MADLLRFYPTPSPDRRSFPGLQRLVGVVEAIIQLVDYFAWLSSKRKHGASQAMVLALSGNCPAMSSGQKSNHFIIAQSLPTQFQPSSSMPDRHVQECVGRADCREPSRTGGHGAVRELVATFWRAGHNVILAAQILNKGPRVNVIP